MLVLSNRRLQNLHLLREVTLLVANLLLCNLWSAATNDGVFESWYTTCTIRLPSMAVDGWVSWPVAPCCLFTWIGSKLPTLPIVALATTGVMSLWFLSLSSCSSYSLGRLEDWNPGTPPALSNGMTFWASLLLTPCFPNCSFCEGMALLLSSGWNLDCFFANLKWDRGRNLYERFGLDLMLCALCVLLMWFNSNG